MANNQPNSDTRRSWRDTVIRGWRSVTRRMSLRSSRVAPLMNEEGLEEGANDEILTEFLETLQNEFQWSEDTIYDILEKVAVRIMADQWPSSQCHRVTNIIVHFLSRMKPYCELEKQCATVLMTVGHRFPDIIVKKLLKTKHQLPRSLLFAVRNICAHEATTPYIEQLWEHILHVLQMNKVDDDTLVMYEVLNAVISSARRYLSLPTSDEESLLRLRNVHLKSYNTFKLLHDRWSLINKPEVTEEMLSIFGRLFSYMALLKVKDETEWLIEELTKLIPSHVAPVYISQCVNKLLDALIVGEAGGFIRISQVDSTMVLLFKLLNVSARHSDPLSVQNHTLSWNAFITLTILHSDRVVHLLLQNMESDDPDTIISALKVFTNVLQYVPRTDELKSEVVRATIAVFQRDFPSVRNRLLDFIQVLNKHDYLVLHQGNNLILQLIRITFTERSVGWDFRLKCSELLTMVSVPQLLSVVCHPKNYMIFVPTSLIIVENVVRAHSLGRNPYLSGFHANPSQFISPQKLLLHLVMFSSKPYRVVDLGASALTLLGALQPITSLHPVISAPFVQFCSKEIPKLMKVLRGHNQQTLNQEHWEHKLLEFSRKSLVAINDDEWLEPLLLVTMEKINNLDPFYLKDKAFLYRFFAFTLRTSRSTEMVNRMVLSLLRTSHQELDEREGIAGALAVASRSHLELILNQLRAYGAVLTDKDSSYFLTLTKEQQQREWGLLSSTIYSSLSRVMEESRGDIAKHLDGILAFVLQSFRKSIIQKGVSMKLIFLNALAKMTNIICAHQLVRPTTNFPCAEELEQLLMDILKEEPMDTLCSSIRLNAISLIIDLRKFKGFSDWNATLVRDICHSVLCLPAEYSLDQQGSGLTDNKANVDLYRDTLECVLRLLQTLVKERPYALEELLEGLGSWISSKNHQERDRAMWCTSQLFSYVADNLSFNAEIEFTKLDHLVKLLALRCHDEVDSVCLLSSQAVYHLHRIFHQQKQMTRKKMNLLNEEAPCEDFTANSFYKNLPTTGVHITSNIVKALAEFLNKTQLTNLVLDVIDSLMGDAKVSLVSAQLLRAILRERSEDMLQVEELVRAILRHLESTQEPRTKDNLLHALCRLAGQRTSTVMQLLLSLPLPWDRHIQVLWRELGKARDTAFPVLHHLASILDVRDTSRESMETEHVAVSCALLEILTDSMCQEAAQELFPPLIMGVLTHVYWAAEKNKNMKVDNPDRNFIIFKPLSSAIQAVRALILAAGHKRVVWFVEERDCWDDLSYPERWYSGVITLTRAMVSSCPIAVIRQMLDLTRHWLESFDYHQKLLAQSIYAQLLWHRSVADTLGQEALNTIEIFINDPDPTVKEVGLLGMSHLALHPKLSQPLSAMVPVLIAFLRTTPRLKIYSLKAMRNIITNTRGDCSSTFSMLYKELHHLIINVQG